MRMKDKIGIVTAAASGMGRAGALRFAREGAAVGVVDIDGPVSSGRRARSRRREGARIAIVADLTKRRGLAAHRAGDGASASSGLDFVWNHVGHPGPAAVEGIDMKDFDLAMTLNLRTVLITTEAALPELRARGGGALLFTASTSGLAGLAVLARSIRCAKHGVVGFVRAWPCAMAREKIRVNAICPGPIDTPMLRVFVARPDQKSTRGRRQGRAGAPARRAESARPHRAAGGGRQRGAVPAVG